MSGQLGFVYLLHLDGRINPGHACRHYIGYTDDLGRRIAEHRAGGPAAARLLQVAHERGIGFTVARVWRGDRRLERRIKRQKHGPAYCPVCGGRRWLDWADELPAAAVERLIGAAFSSVFPVAFLDGRPLPFGGAPFVIDGGSLLVFAILILAAALALRGARRGGGDRMG